MDELLGRYDGLWALVPFGAAFGLLGMVGVRRWLRQSARRKFRAPWRTWR